MAESFQKLAQQQVPNAATAFYTVPASTQAILKYISLVNMSGGAATIKLWQSGAADGNVILPTISMLSGEFAEFDGAITMDAGDTLRGISSVNNAFTITVDGLEIT